MKIIKRRVVLATKGLELNSIVFKLCSAIQELRKDDYAKDKIIIQEVWLKKGFYKKFQEAWKELPWGGMLRDEIKKLAVEGKLYAIKPGFVLIVSLPENKVDALKEIFKGEANFLLPEMKE